MLVSVLPLLLRRVESNTVLPGTMKEEELDYYAYEQAAVKKAKNEPVPSPTGLRVLASAMGYNTLLLAMSGSLDLLALPLWPAAQKRMVESFVLQGLDVIPQTAGIPAGWVLFEEDLVLAAQHLTPRIYGPAFCAAVLHKWRSNAVSSVLRARGVLQTGVAAYQQHNA